MDMNETICKHKNIEKNIKTRNSEEFYFFYVPKLNVSFLFFKSKIYIYI